MQKELTIAEKARIFDKFLLKYRAQQSMNPQQESDLAAADFRAELQKHRRGEPIEIPPPVKRRSA